MCTIHNITLIMVLLYHENQQYDEKHLKLYETFPIIQAEMKQTMKRY